ncbi:MAG: hypothetical protein GTO63_31720 [Anaerolineae bacterium]|nr:hypothetical protein [Anaerolineae bacterium]
MELGVGDKWGWTLVIGALLIGISWRPFLFASQHFQPLYNPLHISVIALLVAGVALVVLSLSAVRKK